MMLLTKKSIIMKNVFSFIFMFAILTMVGCSSNELETIEPELSQERATEQDVQSKSASKKAEQNRPTIWVDCYKFTGLVVPATFKPKSHSFDNLYAMPGATFYGGVPLISDSKPGDQDYNGGRWHMLVLKEGVDPAKYAEACSEEDLDMYDFESTGNYFECPLLPYK